MHRFAVFIGDTTHRRVGQADDAKADQHPERGHKRRCQNIVGPVRADQFRVNLLQGFNGIVQTARCIDHTNQQHQGANQHHHALHGVI
ncbi:hypothetical protein D3C71_1632550 [compost metagenome]